MNKLLLFCMIYSNAMIVTSESNAPATPPVLSDAHATTTSDATRERINNCKQELRNLKLLSQNKLRELNQLKCSSREEYNNYRGRQLDIIAKDMEANFAISDKYKDCVKQAVDELNAEAGITNPRKDHPLTRARHLGSDLHI